MRRLTTVRNSIEAALLQHALEAEGIKSVVTNVHTGTMLPNLYGMLGHGIQVMVGESDYGKARQYLLKREGEGRISTCPNCGSRSIVFGMQGKRRLGERLLILLSLIAAVPMGNIRNRYYCRDCGIDFE